MSLIIEHIRLHHGTVPAEVVLSYGRTSSIRYVLVELTAGGFTGVGEGQSAEPASAVAMGQSLLGQDARRLDVLIPPTAFDWRKSIVRELYSMALHDLVARAGGLPLWALLGGWQQERIRMMPCIFPRSPEHAGEVARQFVDQGYTAVKVKLLGDLEGDRAIIEQVRAAAPQAYVQGDANCGYKSLSAAQAVLPVFVDAGLNAVEDPADVSLAEHEDLMALDRRPAILLDMPTRGDAALHNVITRRCCDGVNLHVNMQGTYSEVRERAGACRMASLHVQVGGTGYTGVGTMASLHLAAAFGIDLPAGEIGGDFDHGVPESTSRTRPDVHQGFAHLPQGPGHGGELACEFLTAHAQTVELRN